MYIIIILVGGAVLTVHRSCSSSLVEINTPYKLSVKKTISTSDNISSSMICGFSETVVEYRCSILKNFVIALVINIIITWYIISIFLASTGLEGYFSAT